MNDPLKLEKIKLEKSVIRSSIHFCIVFFPQLTIHVSKKNKEMSAGVCNYWYSAMLLSS